MHTGSVRTHCWSSSRQQVQKHFPVKTTVRRKQPLWNRHLWADRELQNPEFYPHVQLCWWTLQKKNILKEMIKPYYYRWWWGCRTSRVRVQCYCFSSCTWLNQCVLCAMGTSDDQVTWEAVISTGRGRWTSRDRRVCSRNTRYSNTARQQRQDISL